MKRYAFISMIVLATLTGCISQPGYLLSRRGLDEQDRILLDDTHTAAEEAKSAAAQAAADAKAAHDAADKAQAAADKAAADAQTAGADAQAVNTKIDRMVGEQGK